MDFQLHRAGGWVSAHNLCIVRGSNVYIYTCLLSKNKYFLKGMNHKVKQSRDGFGLEVMGNGFTEEVEGRTKA